MEKREKIPGKPFCWQLDQCHRRSHHQVNIVQTPSMDFRRRSADPDVKALRKLVSDRKPSHPKSVLFVGNLPSEIDEDRLTQFIQKRAASAGVTHSIKMHNCSIVTKQQEDGLTSATARITVSQSYDDILSDKMFWPRPVYARKWILRQPATNMATSLDLLNAVEASAEVQ